MFTIIFLGFFILGAVIRDPQYLQIAAIFSIASAIDILRAEIKKGNVNKKE